MVMEITEIDKVLADVGLRSPALHCLEPNEELYRVLLMQPEGHILANAEGVRNENADLARMQFQLFLEEAARTRADLVIAPEYSTPWDAIANCIEADCLPPEGALWVLGCESIRIGDLDALARRLEPRAIVVREDLPSEGRLFTDPLAYIFRARPTTGNGATRTVLLVQFKTTPMGDPDNFEVKNLQRGSRVYKFGGGPRELSLVSLVCSDAFEFKAHVTKLYDRALVIHIQLNQNPRHHQYRGYREDLFGFPGDATELICLNWAHNIQECCGAKTRCWKNIGGSAWYAKSQQLDVRDEALNENHKRGLYYTWLGSAKAHALFFNFAPATYMLAATKVAHLGVPAPKSHRLGPRLLKTHFWDPTSNKWAEQEVVDDGFLSVCCQSGPAEQTLAQIAVRNPLEVERLLALSAGELVLRENWHDVRYLDSVGIDGRELIRRITFCQDQDNEVKEFRVARLKRCAHLWNILRGEPLPPALRDLRDGFTMEWSPQTPHQNVTATSSNRRATAIYLGEDASSEKANEVEKTVTELLRRSLPEPEMRRIACQRVGVWFRGCDGKIAYLDRPQYRQFDTAADTSEFDIGRQE
jgi:hypothetical protein